MRRLEVNKVDALCVLRHLVSHSSLCVWGWVIMKSNIAVPTWWNDSVFVSPIIKRRHILIMFFKLFHFCSVFDVDWENSSPWVSNKQFTVSLVKANAGYVSSCQLSEHWDKSSVCCVPNFNAFWMCSDESVENWIVKDTNTCLVVGKMMVGRFIVIIKHESSTSCNYSFWMLCQGKTVNLVQRTVKSLNCCECSDIPNSKHTWNISWNDLMSSW